MRATDVIAKKRDGGELSSEEIEFLVHGYTRGDIPDYQAAAWLMAVYLRGLSDRETRDLTLAMAHSGDVLDVEDIAPHTVDKHSTGGVGDKVSMVVAPIAAACGVPIAKISGRGLGFTGGTLDKLESIPGYRADLSEAEIRAQLKEVGIVVTGQTGSLAPADGKLYALRDVTATVGSTPLIVSSILSKKIAGGARAIVLDVKTGSGALMKTLEDAEELAEALVSVCLGGEVRLHAVALVSDMNQPLGWAVGNALEVKEAIDTLHGAGPPGFREHCLAIAGEMLVLGGKAHDIDVARDLAQEAIGSGTAWQKFRVWIAAQGGDVRAVDEPARLPKARFVDSVPAPRSGYLAGVGASDVGRAVVALGGGREKKGDEIDHAVGVEIHYKVGDKVDGRRPLFTVHANDEGKLAEARRRVLAAHTFSDGPTERPPLFYRRIESSRPV
jgi:pyrimidine-nucleoside phosphorylase